ncbi:MAG TPA: hypothetical protein VMF62_16700 [Acetobacteraceae bacterium]|jgi:hypothetical protein|nr:hypothetical protein [Acetobacteraceae bacterium]
MNRILSLAMAAGFLLAGAPLALAAPTQSSIYGHRGVAQSNETPPPPLFSVLGTGVIVDAPVAAPYCNCATQNFAGQPMRGREAPIAPGTGFFGR